ncbi:phosphate ABC transporter permease subunit PstC [uncultured Methanolobus sp.]|uniref:phosphate ABC transporter permease subunit PstC n=1 Tax=uncultured Methanolobus sp. TaxID=218300 RepID=UPI0029C7CA1D|nr:phosphate ABC transporter permease subunit PstC [uncultured Methanolobus sp.]
MKNVEANVFRFLLTGCTVFTILITILLVGSIFYVAFPVFQSQGFYFLYGDVWSYNEEIFGIRNFILGTIAVTTVTMILAFPVSLFTAIFLSEYAPKAVVNILRPMIELLVGIPSVVYGIFGLFVLEDIFENVVDPFLESTLGFIPLFVDYGQSGQGILLASTVLAIMILPTIISITEDSLRSVSYSYKEGSFALGANHWQTIKKIVIPTASNGIIAGAVLGIMRAMGETMAIVMLLGNIPHAPKGVMDVGYAMTSKILNDITYHLVDDSARSALFGIAAVLFLMEMIIVSIARKVRGGA